MIFCHVLLEYNIKNKGVNFNVPHISFLSLTGVGC